MAQGSDQNVSFGDGADKPGGAGVIDNSALLESAGFIRTAQAGSESDKIFNDAFNSFAKGDFKPFADLFNNPNFNLEQIQGKFEGVSISRDNDGIRLSINDREHPSVQRILKISPDGKASPEVRGDTNSLEYLDFQMKLPKLSDGKRVNFSGWEQPFIKALKSKA